MQSNYNLKSHHEGQAALLSYYADTGETPTNLRYQLDTRLNLDHDDFIQIHRIQEQAEKEVLQVLIKRQARIYRHQPPSLTMVNTTQVPGSTFSATLASPENVLQNYRTHNNVSPAAINIPPL